MREKIKIIIQQGVFFFAFGILLLMIWQGLEQIFYGKVIETLFDTFMACTMIPILWDMAEYLTISIKGLHFSPVEEYKEKFKTERIYYVVKKSLTYITVWIIGFYILCSKNDYKNIFPVTGMIGILFIICLWITSKYTLIKWKNPGVPYALIEDAIENVQNSRNQKKEENTQQFLSNRIYLIFKEGDQCYYELYNLHNYDDNFLGFQINFYRFEFLKLNNTRKKLVLDLLNQALGVNTLDLPDLMLALKSYKIAYNLVFVPIPGMTGEEAMNAYTTRFLPFYKDCLNAKLYRPIQ